MAEEQKVLAWRVEFEDGSVELWPAEDIKGEPAFGRWVTPLVAGGPAVDLAPEQDGELSEETNHGPQIHEGAFRSRA
ncbi:TPA: hypothetical protein RY214_004767 [Pseudomonas aeruginosa]|uniref:Uncharacterized protein n=1 Tax=Pseudomonas paraeruginosa TaxID=2994495 RepID=A0A2R3IKN9_9PSED|nr:MULTISPECIES: hypothetical protein [Pseudomonas aeruginosa group]AVK02495.1 hypothetical protein CSB93_7077 [Pseudomonas paraeruginosa]AWE88963.1 hypothetical protein CSC28_6998 [Pseudomonas paraeruginosa]EKX0428517.1 hypothetical protein [Pseudomonas aeruginosa]MCV0038376.1 hypothetical protein [Pseudomonas aeruginosa]MDS9770510.1 hypothetical protein [Pseudomonas aeruginosa]